jgi:hypothetical protein
VTREIEREGDRNRGSYRQIERDKQIQRDRGTARERETVSQKYR